MSCLSINLSRAVGGLSIKPSRAGGGLVARCSIVCSLAHVADFLEITPTEIQWITDDIGVFFDVQSNVEWIITTD